MYCIVGKVYRSTPTIHKQSLLLVAKILATEFGFVPDNTDQVTIQLHLHNLTHMMSLGYKEF